MRDIAEKIDGDWTVGNAKLSRRTVMESSDFCRFSPRNTTPCQTPSFICRLALCQAPPRSLVGTSLLETLDGELNALAHGHSSARPEREGGTKSERNANKKYLGGLGLWTSVNSHSDTNRRRICCIGID
jgi:hypothetical protein